MNIKGSHFSYCTNIHAGESWKQTFTILADYLPYIKNRISPEMPFGVGLRLSSVASSELIGNGQLEIFKEWLSENNLYIFTLNGFPYGNFHLTKVKDQVHAPDWTTQERVVYTKNLSLILADLLPAGMEGGISTSPVSYRFWHKSEQARKDVITSSLRNLISVISHLHDINISRGVVIHIDIEPEPDGLLENSVEFISWYKNTLLNLGIPLLEKRHSISAANAEQIIRRHVRLCYDTCHFALEFEYPAEVVKSLNREGILIGKVQVSSAIELEIPTAGKMKCLQDLKPFAESNYLHQVRIQTLEGNIVKIPDLDVALAEANDLPAGCLRTHFHVPVFLENYGNLSSTRNEIEKTFDAISRQDCQHFEVETYTWEVLPPVLKSELKDFIVKELEWVKPQIINLKER